MRYRMICVALAGLTILAMAAPSPAATQSYRCTDTAAVTTNLARLAASCGVDVSCPGPASCSVELQGFGKGLPSIDLTIFINDSFGTSCFGYFSCQTFGFMSLAPGDSIFVSVVARGNPAAVLAEARLVVKRTS